MVSFLFVQPYSGRMLLSGIVRKLFGKAAGVDKNWINMNEYRVLCQLLA
jgi:hypothetical protein